MVVVHQFNPEIYPCLLWVVIGKDVDIRRFPVSTFDENSIAQTEVTNDMENNRNGIMIRVRKKSDLTAEVCAHEAVHAGAEIMRYVGGRVDVDNQEPFAYLVGWIADCIDQVKKNKFKDYESKI